MIGRQMFTNLIQVGSKTIRQLGRFILLSAVLSSFGCGYRWGQNSTLAPYQSISVPYIEGDWNGELTSELVSQISQMGTLRYCSEGGALRLQVKLLDYRTDNIGFRYDRNRDGKLISSIIPNETRLTAWAEVAVIEAASGGIVLGPARLSAEVDFDHDYYSSPHAINVFSLGQLTDYDEAYDAAERPLNRRLAQKIVDYINDGW